MLTSGFSQPSSGQNIKHLLSAKQIAMKNGKNISPRHQGHENGENVMGQLRGLVVGLTE